MNSVSRYFLPASEWQGDILTLTGDEAHHCSRVLRSRVGDVIEVFDGAGRCATAELLDVGKATVRVGVVEQSQEALAACPIALYQAIPKGSNMDWIIQKAVELGVNEIFPLITENTVARSEQLDKKQKKWQRAALEACKQCGQNWLPKVHEIESFDAGLAKRRVAGVEVIAALDPRSRPIKEVLSEALQSKPNDVSLLVGPEGDFSQAEYDESIESGFLPVSIGEIVLKVETATMYCLSTLRYELS